MKKHRLHLLGTVFALLILALGFSLNTVLALQLCNPVLSYAGRTVQSCKDNYVVSGNQYWRSTMVSKVVNGSGVTSLGFDSWTDTRYCNGSPINFYDNGPRSGVGISYYGYSTSHTLTSPPCAGTHESRVYGTHYWQQTGYTRKTETWSYWKNLP